MFVLSHASVAAQLEAFFSVDGGLENSKEWVLESGEDIVVAFASEYQSEVKNKRDLIATTSRAFMTMRLSWAKAYKIILVPRSQKAARHT
jgi:hypothetical protein